MKVCWNIEKELSKKYSIILNHDKIEIDNPDKYHFRRLDYIDRLKKIMSIIKKMFPAPYKIRIADFGCAQGNMSLILAESGYEVYAIDIDPIFIEYSKMKYEKGDINWIIGNIDSLDISMEKFDVAIAGELIEHCAYPEVIVDKILKYIRPGGLLILTTPNGSIIRNKLPTFKQVFSKEQRKVFEEKQYGPDSTDHLFLFRLDELEYIIPKDVEIMDKGYLGGTILFNKYSYNFLKIFPIQIVEYAPRILSKIPIINSKIFNNIYIVINKS